MRKTSCPEVRPIHTYMQNKTRNLLKKIVQLYYIKYIEQL